MNAFVLRLSRKVYKVSVFSAHQLSDSGDTFSHSKLFAGGKYNCCALAKEGKRINKITDNKY
jgi:hypothetical protein